MPEPSSAPSSTLPHTSMAALVAATAATACFIGMDALAKLLSPRYDAWQLTFMRFASGSLFAGPLWLWFRTPLPQGTAWRLHALRVLLLLVALVGWFHALSLLPLVQAVAVGYTAPLFISVLAMLVLHERPSRWIWAALGLGGVGVAVALWPELTGSQAGSSRARLEGLASAGLSALSYSGVVILARHQAQRDSLWTIMLVQNLLPTGLLAIPMAWRWAPLASGDGPLVLAMGVLATGGLMGVTWAYTRLEASRAAPLEYTGFVWAAALGFFVFGEVPTATSLGSAALIIAGCLLLVRR